MENVEEETLADILNRIGRRFSQLIDEDRASAYKFLRREIVSNMRAFVMADEVTNISQWVTALAKIEEGMGGDQADDIDYPLDKIAKMLNENGKEE